MKTPKKRPNTPAAQVRKLIERECKPGKPIVLVAHDPDCAAVDERLFRGRCTCTPERYLVEEMPARSA